MRKSGQPEIFAVVKNEGSPNVSPPLIKTLAFNRSILTQVICAVSQAPGKRHFTFSILPFLFIGGVSVGLS